MEKPDRGKMRMLQKSMDRRTFLKAAGVAGGALAAGGCAGIPDAHRKLHILRWVDFIPAADAELKRQAIEASKALGAEVTFEFINVNDLQARTTAAIESGVGPDIIQLIWNWPHLYAKALVDVSDVAQAIGEAQGGFYDLFHSTAKVDGRWLAVPQGVIGNAVAYRRSWHEEIGVKEFPKTWEAWREVGKKLKAKGRPIGQALGHTFGDPPTFAYPLLWSFGGTEVEEDGKKVAINSQATVESLKFMQAFWKDGCHEGGLAWDDASNNRAFHAGEISATLNGGSIYVVAKRRQDRFKDEKGQPLHLDIEHGPLPAGPAGQFALYVPFQHGVMKYSRNQTLAKDFLKWLHQKENYEKWLEAHGGYSVGSTKLWEDHPMWAGMDKPLQVFRQAARRVRMYGYPGPPTPKATEVYVKFIIVGMFAKAIQGMKAEDAAKWAEGELRKIYG